MAVTTHKKASFDEGSLDQYLRDISAYPLISREEEVRLAQRIRVADQEACLVAGNIEIVLRARLVRFWANENVSANSKRPAGTQHRNCFSELFRIRRTATIEDDAAGDVEVGRAYQRINEIDGMTVPL